MSFVCKNCMNRECGCHATCELYIEAKEEHESNRAMILQNKQLYKDLNGLSIQRHRRRK